AVRGTEVAAVLFVVESGACPRPREFRPDTPAALDAVCRRAMAHKPESRYPSALALAADVERWLADEPVTAYPEPWATRARRWTKRHRTLVTGAAAALLVALVSLAVAAALLGVKNQELERAGAGERA